MARGRGRPKAPPPPYEQFTSKTCAEYLKLRDATDQEIKEANTSRTDVNKRFRDKGLDLDPMNYVLRLRTKVNAGKLTYQDAIAKIDRLNAYADWAFGDQTDLFRNDAAEKPAAPTVEANAAQAGAGIPEAEVVDAPAATVEKPKANGKGSAEKKPAKVTKGDAQAALAAAQQHLGTAPLKVATRALETAGDAA